MKEKSSIWLAGVLMAVFAATRWPGLLPPNFSASYALVFCAGVYFRNRLGWLVPLVILALTDLAIDAYYTFFAAPRVDAFQWYQLLNYPAYAALFWLGRRFKPQARWTALLGGGVLGAIVFYLLTNTAAWLFNPFGNLEYTRDFAGWLIALTKGTAGHAETWRFFLNTLLSGGLFTGLFVGAMKLTASESAREKEAPEPVEEAPPAPAVEPEEARP